MSAGDDPLIVERSAFEEPGPRVQLGRSLKNRHVEMIAIGGIIGAGLFVGSSAAIAATGPAVIISYALAGFLVLLVMRMLSEMAAAIPGVQTFPDFPRLGLGRWAGFFTGWLYWYFWVVVVAIEAIAGAIILQGWIALPVWVIGVALVAVLTLVNLMSTRSFGEFEFWFSSLKVAAIAAFILIAGAYAFGVGSGDAPTFSNFHVVGGFMPNGPGSVLAGVTTVIFSLIGAEIATVAAAESEEPARSVARVTASVAVRIIVFYILSIALILCVVPWDQIVPGFSPFTAAMDKIGIPFATTIMNLVVLVAVLSCMNSGLYVTSRVLFSLASHGDAPSWIVSVNRRQVPVRAIMIASLFAYGALAASILSPEVVFTFLVNASGSLMLIVYAVVALAQIKLRRVLERDTPDRIVIRMWLFPWLSYAAVIGIGLVLVAMAVSADMRSQFISSAAVSLLCLAIYYWLHGRKARG